MNNENQIRKEAEMVYNNARGSGPISSSSENSVKDGKLQVLLRGLEDAVMRLDIVNSRVASIGYKLDGGGTDTELQDKPDKPGVAEEIPRLMQLEYCVNVAHTKLDRAFKIINKIEGLI